jgi:L-ascorbate metabolism protein UlaG (beta-lactamase superfamily)
MDITFYAHACFRLIGDGRVIITDPYTPGPHGSGFDPINEPADIVIMSSATDRFHADPSHILGNPTVINALELPSEGATVRGLSIRSFPAMENLPFDFRRDPDANAMYLFTVDDIRVLHMGDIGNPLSSEQISALRDKVDVLLALTGGHATIALDDLDTAIGALLSPARRA